MVEIIEGVEHVLQLLNLEGCEVLVILCGLHVITDGGWKKWTRV